MPTIPILNICYFYNATEYVAVRDASGEITSVQACMETLAVALTVAEWVALKTAIRHPGQWIPVTGDTDSR